MQLHSNRLESLRNASNVTVHGSGKFKMKYISINLENRPSYFAIKKNFSELIPVSKKRRSLQ